MIKKVLVFGITDLKGGVESVIMNYYRNIDRTKIQFDFLCNTEKVAYEDEIRSLGGRIFKITARSKNPKKYKVELENIFKKNSKNYSAIWVNVCSLANIDYLKMAKKYNIKKRIIHSHNSKNMDSKIRGILHRINRIFIKKYATDFWACSNDAAKWFFSKKIIKSNKYKMINNAIDIEKYQYNVMSRNQIRKELNADESTFIVGNIGRFHFQKNHPFIIKVFKEVHKKIKNSLLILIGEGEDIDKIKKMVKEENLQKNVLFLGTRDDIPRLLSGMDAFLFPSFFEGLSLTSVEATANGIDFYAKESCMPKFIIETKNFHAIDITNEIDVANELIKNKKNARINNKETLNKNGLNIKIEAKKMQEYFEE